MEHDTQTEQDWTGPGHVRSGQVDDDDSEDEGKGGGGGLESCPGHGKSRLRGTPREQVFQKKNSVEVDCLFSGWLSLRGRGVVVMLVDAILVHELGEFRVGIGR